MSKTVLLRIPDDLSERLNAHLSLSGEKRALFVYDAIREKLERVSTVRIPRQSEHEQSPKQVVKQPNQSNPNPAKPFVSRLDKSTIGKRIGKKEKG